MSKTEVSAVAEAVLNLLETLRLSQVIPSKVERVVAHGGHNTEDQCPLFPRNLVQKTIAEARRDIDDTAVLEINTAYACLRGNSKQVSVSITEPETVQDLSALCYRLAGGEAAFQARPFLTVMVCHVVPPMRFAEEPCETLRVAVLAGFPVQLISARQAGATSPAMIACSLVQAVAETLAGLVFARLVDPAVRAIFAPKPLVADLRTGSMCGGGGEQAILMAAAAQVGRHYDLPTSSIAGITDAKTLDAQFGSEKCLAVAMAAHAGSNLITKACGVQASLLSVSLAAYVADNGMLGNILRTLRGDEATPVNLAARPGCSARWRQPRIALPCVA